MGMKTSQLREAKKPPPADLPPQSATQIESFPSAIPNQKDHQIPSPLSPVPFPVFQTSSNSVTPSVNQFWLSLDPRFYLMNGGHSVIKYPTAGSLLFIWLIVLDPCNVLCLFFGQTFKEFCIILCRLHSNLSVAPM